MYKLRSLGIRANEIGGGLPFDVTALAGECLLRVQVKTTSTYRSTNRFRFLTWRGRFGSDGQRPITEYSNSETDLVALVALPLEAVIFRHVSQVGAITMVPKSEFIAPNCTFASFEDAVKLL